MDPLLCICKIIQKIGDEESIIKLEDNVKLKFALSNIGHFALKKSLPDVVLETIIKLVLKCHSKDSIKFFSEFLLEATKHLKKDDKHLNANSKLLLYSHVPSALEQEVLGLLNLCSDIDEPSKLYLIKNKIFHSSLPQACSTCSKTFQRVINILGHAWFKSGGNIAVTCLIGLFVKNVQEFCLKSSFLDLFPMQLCHLVLLLSLHPYVFMYSELNLYIEHIIMVCTDTLKNRLCTEKDIIMLLIMFPTCYDKLIRFYDEQRAPCTEYFYQQIWNSSLSNNAFCSIKEAKSVLECSHWSDICALLSETEKNNL